MGVLFSEEFRSAIECLLFVADEPLPEEKIAEIIGAGKDTVGDILQDLKESYRGRGFELVEIGGGWQFCTRPELAGVVERLYRPKVSLLSKAALETLAIVAYRQPITRAEVEEIRGVKIEGVLSTLLEKKLIQDVGRKNCPGRPILYGTTPEFLRYFGLKTISELPPLEEFTSCL